MIRLTVHGADGRMGTRICALAGEDDRFEIVSRVTRGDTANRPAAGARSSDVCIDFSTPEGTLRAARLAVEEGAALLVGTTGLTRQILDATDESARSVPVMIAPNTALGVAVLDHLVAEATRLLGERFDIDLIETHHASKRDAPSGTALRLAATVRRESPSRLSPERIHAVRAGDVIGDHEVSFSGPGERLRILHSATTRDVFARGALHAAAWLCGRSPGRYTIEDALGLDSQGSGAMGPAAADPDAEVPNAEVPGADRPSSKGRGGRA